MINTETLSEEQRFLSSSLSHPFSQTLNTQIMDFPRIPSPIDPFFSPHTLAYRFYIATYANIVTLLECNYLPLLTCEFTSEEREIYGYKLKYPICHLIEHRMQISLRWMTNALIQFYTPV